MLVDTDLEVGVELTLVDLGLAVFGGGVDVNGRQAQVTAKRTLAGIK